LATTSQHQNNSTWADVDFATQNNNPGSIVVLVRIKSWQCHVLVHMFHVTYSKAVSINQFDEPVIDHVGFVYEVVTLEDEKTECDATKPVMSFALILPNRDKEGDLRFCVLDKDWRFIGVDRKWIILN
jgi:hypothetical protein